MRRVWIPAVLAIVLWAAILPFPLLIDTGTFAFVAERWSEGATLYAEVADNKPPGTIAAWRVALALAGRAKPHVAIELAMQAASLALLVAFARRAWSDDVALRAGVLWVVTTFAYLKPDTIAESETLCLPLLVATLWIGTRAFSAARPAALHAVLGAVGGTLIAVKIVPIAVPAAVTLWLAWRRRRDASPVAAIAAFAGGTLAALAPWVLWMHLEGGLDELLALYTGWQSPTSAPWSMRPLMLAKGILFLVPAGILAILGLVRLRRALAPPDEIALAALAGACLAVLAQGKFFFYHFLLALPSLVVLGARWWAIVRSEPAAKPVGGIVLALLLVGGPVARRAPYLLETARYATGAATRDEYLAQFRIEVPHASRAVAGVLADPVADRALAAAIPPRSSVLLWGLAPQVLFRAEATSASRFPHLLPYACAGCDPAFRDELVRELQADPPERVVVQRDLVNYVDIGSMKRGERLLREFPELASWIDERYALAGTHGGFALYVKR